MNIKLGIPLVIAGILSGCGFSEAPGQPPASSSKMAVAVQNPPSVSPDSEELWQQALSAYQNWMKKKHFNYATVPWLPTPAIIKLYPPKASLPHFIHLPKASR